METYNSKEEAQKVAGLMSKEEIYNRFCPLVNGSCQEDCVCFIDAWVANRVENKYTVEGFCCGNVMFFGND